MKGSNQPASGLVAASPATSFRTDDAAGHFVYTTATFANVPGDYPVATLQIRAWETRGGTITNWSQVLSDPTIPRGASPLFTVTNIGGVLNTPPLVLPHQSFNLHIATKDGPSLEDAVMSASGFEFTVNDQSADRNQIEYRSLADTNWIYLAIVSNHYGKVRFKDLFAPDVPRFYRAVRLP